MAHWPALALLLIASLGSTAAGAVSPDLTARPNPTVHTSLATGVTKLDHGAYAYVPRTGTGSARPLIVFLHGSDGHARDYLRLMQPLAERRGYVVLAPQSADWNWDMAAGVYDRMGRPQSQQEEPRFGRDVARIDAVLKQLFERVAIDPQRVVLMGFSDGAGYTLSLGLANPQLFRGLVALSPGFAKVPPRIGKGQRVVIAHGRRDSRIPFDTGRDMAEALRQAGLDVRFLPFDGPHVITRSGVTEGLDFALGR